MKRMLIAAHAEFAEGLLSALNLIMGKRDNITTINAFVSETPLEEQIDDFAASLKEGDQVLVVTDAFFGSVNQKLIGKHIKNSINITGANLPLVLELAALLDGEEPITADQLRSIVDLARKQLMLVETEEAINSSDDFDF